MSKLLSAQNVLNLLLIFVPIAIVLEYIVHARAEWIFVTSCLAIIPLAGLMGKATEHLAEHVGRRDWRTSQCHVRKRRGAHYRDHGVAGRAV